MIYVWIDNHSLVSIAVARLYCGGRVSAASRVHRIRSERRGFHRHMTEQWLRSTYSNATKCGVAKSSVKCWCSPFRSIFGDARKRLTGSAFSCSLHVKAREIRLLCIKSNPFLSSQQNKPTQKVNYLEKARQRGFTIHTYKGVTRSHFPVIS